MTNSINLKVESTTIIQESKTSSQQCQICGAPALFSNYGVISCSSCKMFFKRNAELKQDSFICDFSNQCEITLYSRRICAACRLAKCFTKGMQIGLIRGSRTKKNTKRKNKKNSIEPVLSTTTSSTLMITTTNSQPCQLSNQLQLDPPTLSIEQWNLITNLTHTFDEYSGLTTALIFKNQQNLLPYKFRFKLGSVSEFIKFIMNNIPQIIEKNRDFRSLSLHDRSILLRNTIKYSECIGATFILHQSHLLDDPYFNQSNEFIFGSDVMSTIIRLSETFDSDATFVKLIFAIIGFSTITYTVYSDNITSNLIDIKAVLRIQDKYVELAWQYMVFKYSYEQAVIRFCQLIKFLFKVNFTIVESSSIEEYSNLISSIIQQTEQNLMLNN
ncbi:unnamed protein product [Adineta steineri]|uniref:Nuclear receptor domain-containing protein n=1 Tax=Adineta steineri TaxID=433720 RepID=A0A814XV57_9BILA|nr:unnamed protein product [Adineta steineri]CAF3770126.1 unnamed protein product [Adineta steineri]